MLLAATVQSFAHMPLELFQLQQYLTLWRPAAFGDFGEKNA